MSKRPIDPLPKLRRIAELRGWKSLRRYVHDFGDKPFGDMRFVTHYESGGKHMSLSNSYLQINESPIGRKDQYLACVYALPYRLCSGWHFFRLPHGRTEMKKCVEMLAAWLAKSHFASLAGRRDYRAAHPETTGYTQKFLFQNREPYIVFDGEAGITARNTPEGRRLAARASGKMDRHVRRRLGLRG